jgi:hypothetical protein
MQRKFNQLVKLLRYREPGLRKKENKNYRSNNSQGLMPVCFLNAVEK